MKKIFSIIIGALVTTLVFAQAPQKMSYQAVIRNSSDALITSSPVGMRISIIQGSIFGASVYVETQTASTNANGLVSLAIGTGTPVTGTFAGIDWAAGPYFIKTETDPTGGSAYTISGTNELMSVPYALFSVSGGAGPVGPAGPIGLTGPSGPIGPAGPMGSDGFTHYIGEQFGGGVIFHLWKDGAGVEHGLIVDKTYLSTSQAWSNVADTIDGASAQSSWDGLNNSNAIVAQVGHISSAASLCLNSTNGGQSDWYLPSIDELSLFWHNSFIVNKTLSTISGASEIIHISFNWSSTEWLSTAPPPFGGHGAWAFAFDGGYPFGVGKGERMYVRAIRDF